MARPLLVLQHAPWERPGLVASVLQASAPGVSVLTRTVLSEPSPALPPAADLAGLVVMGGAMNADDDARFPGLAAERRLLAEAVDADVPVLGVCLGMQLLARALGAAVHARHGTEIGFLPVTVVGQDPVLAPLGVTPTVLHWHSDAAELPPGATLLATTPTTPVQAFRAGSALGLQFHLEVDDALLTAWLSSPEMRAELSGLDIDLAAQAAALPTLVPCARQGLGVFADAVQARS